MPTIWYDVARSTDADPTAIWAETWDAEWEAHYGSADSVRSAERRLRVHPLYRILCAEFPVGARVLEGGCGLAFWVKLLRNEGRDVVGVDFDSRTVERLNEAFPDLPVRQGDVTMLPFEDASLDGYISLGVVEHFVGGPEDALREAWRVLKPGGVLVLAVPYLNPARQALRPLTSALRYAKGRSPDYKFYQYLYSRREMTLYLQAAGFAVRRCYPFAPHMFLTRFPAFRAVFNLFYKRIRGKRLKIGTLNINNRAEPVAVSAAEGQQASLEQRLRRINDVSWLREMFGHEAVFICDKYAVPQSA